MAIGIGELLSGFQFAEKIAHYVKKLLKQPEPETSASRFLALFNAHGVKPSQIPDFFGARPKYCRLSLCRITY